MQDFRQLNVWKKSHALVLLVYARTANFPRSEMFGVTAQCRRAAVSIAANIAEGSSTGSDGEFGRFLRVAFASASELEYFTILISDLRFVDSAEAAKITADIVEVKRMLAGLIARLKAERLKADG